MQTWSLEHQRHITHMINDGLQWTNNSKCNLANLNNIWSLNLHCKCNTLHLDQMCHKSVAFTSWKTWSCACAFTFNVAPSCWWLLPVTDVPRRWSPPKKKKTGKTRVSSARQANPIDHVYKIPLPSQSLLSTIRRSPWYRFYRIIEPISDAWPIILSQ